MHLIRFFLLLLLFISPASASVLLEDQTWVELRDQIASGSTTIIIPIGGTEQNGPHMALGKHNARVKILAEKIALKLGHTFVAPVLAYVPEGSIDPPSAHMKFPGTISVSDSTFMQLLESAAKSFKHAGFKHIILIGDHGSYQKNLVAVAQRLDKLGIHSLAATEYYRLSQSAFEELLISKGFAKSEIGTHAALLDTALQLAVDPHSVRSQKLDDKMTAEQGVYGGSPAQASRELGQLGVDLIVDGTVSAIQKFVGQP